MTLDPIDLQVVTGALRAACEEMGAALVRSAHLPDITVIAPVLDGAGGELLGFAANRAHHADVGGRVPGSMPADSTTLDEEGVVIAPRVLDDAAIIELSGLMRQPAQRRADLRAQLAAN